MRSVGANAARFAALAMAVASGPLLAATIYGSLQVAGQPAPNRDLQLHCDGAVVAGKTDARGAYRFTVGQIGRCELRALDTEAPVILYADPTRYDFDLQRVGGQPRLVRK